MALGATIPQGRGLALGEGLWLATLSTGIGIAGAAAAAGRLRGLLYDVHPLDPAALPATALLVLVASGLAWYLPARRATRADPVALLRTE
jgi:ABC-type lipoprotein release transport system permease subunit